MLKSLELTGFKSFADRTVFRFDAGLTAVVGPNGSGKSNVVDGLKWLLGDQSPKSLRGKEMADVIFNGAAGRRPSGSAEAVLTFDNATRFLPVDDDVVTVGRRLLRSGDSEYRLNGEVGRLKDVRALFAGTGFGSSAYAIIEQGRVDQIIRANATGRRAVFEEVAGIAKFRLCRADAERKLERVDQNLERLTDVVDELEAQLTATRTQAAKAATYRELRNELRDWWVGWAADESRLTEIVTREAGRAAADATAAARRLAAEKTRLDAAIADADAELAEVEPAFHAADRAATAATAALDQLAGGESARAERARAAAETLTRSRAALVEARVAAAEADAESERLDRTVATLAEALAASPEDKPAAAGDCGPEADLLVAITRLEREEDRLDSESRRADRRVTDAEEAVTAAQASLEDAAAARDTAATEAAAAGRAHAAARRVAANRSDLAGHARDASEAASAAERAHRERVDATRGELLRVEARVAVLDELEEKGEGVGLGVRDILARARTVDDAPWCDVLGTVAELLDVPFAEAPVIDVALGDRAASLAVTRVDRLAAYFDRHAARLQGRIGLVAVDGPGVTEPVDLSRHPGVRARLSSLVTAEPDAAGLPERMLGTTWLVDSLSVAIELAAGPGRGQRFVTPQGELLEADGTLAAGPTRAETRLVSRQSERRSLRAEAARLKAELDAISAAAPASDRGPRFAADIAAAAAIAATTAAAEVEVAARAERRRSSRAADRDRELRHVERRIDSLREAATQVAADRETLRLRQEEFSTRLASLRDRRDEAAAAVPPPADTASERARLEERHAAALDSRKRLDADRTRLAEALTRAERELGRAERTLATAELETLAAAAERAARTADRDAAATTAREAGTRLDALRRDRDALRRDRDRFAAETARLRGYEATANAHATKATSRAETLASRVAEEFDVDSDDLPGLDASALKLVAGDPESVTPADPRDLFDHREAIEKRVDRLRRKLKALGSVNPDSLADLDALEERHARLAGQLADLTEARAALRGVIDRVDTESRRLFTETFEIVRGHFRELFRQVFGGGEGDVVLEDPTDPLAGGVEIVARPPGKEPRGLSLLSGGEKTMTCVALMFALFRAKPSPFCVLDEVDAALDEANIERFVRVLELFKRETQFVMITHRKPSMLAADVLHGVTMEEAGVSKRLQIRLDDVAEDGAIATRKAA